MITLCAWHQQTPVPCDPTPYLRDDKRNDGKVSHGICEAHAAYMRAKIEMERPR